MTGGKEDLKRSDKTQEKGIEGNNDFKNIH